MIPDDYTHIINRVLTKTKANKANWRETADPNIVLLNFPDYSMCLSRYPLDDIEGRDAIEFSLLDDKGKQIDSFQVIDDERHWNIMNELFEMARRRAAGITDILGKLEKDLDANNDIGK